MQTRPPASTSPRRGLDELLALSLRLKAVFTDLDGTLLTTGHTVPPGTFETVRRLQATGLRVIPSSGRTLQSVQAFFEPLGDEIDAVASNGADIVVGGVRIARATCPHEDARALLDAVASSDRRLGMAAFTETRTFLFDLEADFARKNIESLCDATVRPTGEGLPDETIVKAAVIAVHDTVGAVRELTARLGGRFAFTPCGEHFIDAAHGCVDKVDGVRTVARLLGAELDEIAAFGDSVNDLLTMEALPVSVAVANAMPELKAACAYEIGPNADGAVLDCLTRMADLREAAGLR